MLQQELQTVLVEVRQQAQQHGWLNILGLIDDLRSGTSSKRILLTAADGVDISSFQHWTTEAVSGLEVYQHPLQSLALNPLLAVAVDKTLVALECGRLIDASAVEAVKNSFFTRPSGSYALVMIGAERIQTPDDLDIVERNIRRLFLTSLLPEWDRQNTGQLDFAAYHIYLWGDTLSPTWLQARVQPDAKALTAWLSVPQTDADALNRYRMLYVIEMAEYELNREEQARLPQHITAETLQRTRLEQARQDLVYLTSHLQQQIERHTTSIKETIATSLGTLQLDLLEGLHSYLAQHQQILSQDAAQFRHSIATYIAESAYTADWRNKISSLLVSSTKDAMSDTEATIENESWSLINQFAKDLGKNDEYPGTLVKTLLQQTALTLPEVQLRQNSTAELVRPEKAGIDNIVRILITTMSGLMAMLLTERLFRKPETRAKRKKGRIILFLSGAGGGNFVTRKIQQQKQLNQQLDAYERYGKAQIQEAIEDLIQLIDSRIEMYRQTLEKHLQAALGSLEQLLDEAPQEATPVGNTFAAEYERLQELRRHIPVNNQ